MNTLKLKSISIRISSFFLQPITLIVLFILIAIASTIQSYFLPHFPINPNDPMHFLYNLDIDYTGFLYTHYNNYLIFKESAAHLFNNLNLYGYHITEHYDLYKYSPTFALFFAPFYVLPNIVGLFLWNLVNAMVLLFAIYKLPGFSKIKQSAISLFVLIELMTSLQNEQSNGLIAGLLILGFVYLEKEKYLWGTLALVSTVFIKLFGLVAFAILLFYPKKWKLALYSLLWTVILAFLPALFVGFEQLIWQYGNWLELLQNDHSASFGFSVMGWLHTWFGLEMNKIAVLIVGVVLFCIPLLKLKQYTQYSFRIQMLASVLLWIIIFNHKAESPTFIIAISGVALWYFSQDKTPINKVLVVLAFIFSSLSPTDIFPHYIRHNIFGPYVVKAVPCILIWSKLIYDLLLNKYTLNKDIKTNKLPLEKVLD